MTYKKNSFRRNRWWTRERVVAALKRFYEEYGFMPTCQDDYQERRKFTGIVRAGRVSTLGWEQKYPSAGTVLNYFPTMRAAWEAAGFECDRAYQEWSPIEDWFIIESCGILPRKETAELLRRSEFAVKRRLYDLGRITANTRWGISLTRAETLLKISQSVISRYIKHGIIPVFRGNKNIYLNPADLMKIEEFDWSRVSEFPELEAVVRKALIQRALKIIKFKSEWRKHELYKFQEKRVYRGRIKNPRESVLLKHTPAPPNDLKVGDWVKVEDRYKQIAAERVGIIKTLRYSWQKCRRIDGNKNACWMAFVEFPKLRKLAGENSRRIHYSIPLDLLMQVEAPEIPDKPLKQTPEAVKSRIRLQKYLEKAAERYAEIKPEIS